MTKGKIKLGAAKQNKTNKGIEVKEKEKFKAKTKRKRKAYKGEKDKTMMKESSKENEKKKQRTETEPHCTHYHYQKIPLVTTDTHRQVPGGLIGGRVCIDIASKSDVLFLSYHHRR